MNLLIIAGMPASGKTTVSQKLSDALGYPILEKDALKEELFDTVGFENYAEKRRLDTAACAVLLRAADALLAANTSLILVNNFREDAAADVRALLEKHNANCVTLFFKGDGDVFYRRYVERDLKGVRHLGHVLQEHYPPHADDALNYTMTREEFAEKFEKLGMDKFNAGGHRIEIDATYPERIDTEQLLADIKQAFQALETQNEKEKSHARIS